MKITVLGTRGEIELQKPGFKKHSGLLIDNKILIDVGEKEYLKYNPRIILVTHLHPDHAFFEAGKKPVKMNTPVYGPETSNKLKGIRILSEPLHKGDYRITPIPTIHSAKVKSQGYVIERAGKRILYSGDLAAIKKSLLYQLKECDLIITEGSFIKKGGQVRRNEKGKLFGHAGIPDLIELFKPLTRHIIFTHFGSWFMKNPSRAAERIEMMGDKDLKISVAHDGMEIRI